MKNRRNRPPRQQSHVLHSIAGSLEEAFSETEDEFAEEDVIVVDVPEKTRKGQGKEVFFFTCGLLVIVFAIIGIISTVIFTSNVANDIANQTALKNEFELYLYPLVATDPPTFEEAGTLTNSTIIRAAISKILLTGDISNYQTEAGLTYIPELDVETNATSLFGGDITIEHETVGSIMDRATYNPEMKAYAISSTNRTANYVPKITNIDSVGETFTLTVEYYPLSASIPGLENRNEVVKEMKYVVVKSAGDRKTVTSISFGGGNPYGDGSSNVNGE
ncbi:MAG: hypothetical protein J1E39_09325 [Eubacterium sp.]|nr:hypothetical protein [Eubacterium sp.]